MLAVALATPCWPRHTVEVFLRDRRSRSSWRTLFVVSGALMPPVVGAAGAQSTGLRVGVSAIGALTIQSGGTVNNTLGIIADQTGSTGTATVDGAGSRWTNSSDFYVGHLGNGALTIRNGGAVSNVHGFIGRYPSSTSTATCLPWSAASISKSTSGELAPMRYSVILIAITCGS